LGKQILLKIHESNLEIYFFGKKVYKFLREVYFLGKEVYKPLSEE